MDEQARAAFALIGTGLGTVFYGGWVFFRRKSKDVSPSQPISADQSTNQVISGDKSTNQLNNINASGDSNVSVNQQVK